MKESTKIIAILKIIKKEMLLLSWKKNKDKLKEYAQNCYTDENKKKQESAKNHNKSLSRDRKKLREQGKTTVKW